MKTSLIISLLLIGLGISMAQVCPTNRVSMVIISGLTTNTITDDDDDGVIQVNGSVNSEWSLQTGIVRLCPFYMSMPFNAQSSALVAPQPLIVSYIQPHCSKQFGEYLALECGPRTDGSVTVKVYRENEPVLFEQTQTTRFGGIGGNFSTEYFTLRVELTITHPAGNASSVARLFNIRQN